MEVDRCKKLDFRIKSAIKKRKNSTESQEDKTNDGQIVDYGKFNQIVKDVLLNANVFRDKNIKIKRFSQMRYQDEREQQDKSGVGMSAVMKTTEN